MGAIDMMPHEEMWIFGYDSLMWRPGFVFEERQVALVNGYHRSLCIYSHVHRGTPERPGLVLGLDRGGRCKGLAFKVAPALRQATLGYLREREQVTAVYRETMVRIRLADGHVRTAVTYTADRSHGQYAGRLGRDALLDHVQRGQGVSGSNPDYVLSTHAKLHEIGVDDPALGWLAQQLRTSSGR